MTACWRCGSRALVYTHHIVAHYVGRCVACNAVILRRDETLDVPADLSPATLDQPGASRDSI